MQSGAQGILFGGQRAPPDATAATPAREGGDTTYLALTPFPKKKLLILHKRLDKNWRSCEVVIMSNKLSGAHIGNRKWADIRSSYFSGGIWSATELERIHGVRRGTIAQHIQRHKWREKLATQIKKQELKLMLESEQGGKDLEKLIDEKKDKVAVRFLNSATRLLEKVEARVMGVSATDSKDISEMVASLKQLHGMLDQLMGGVKSEEEARDVDVEILAKALEAADGGDDLKEVAGASEAGAAKHVRGGVVGGVSESEDDKQERLKREEMLKREERRQKAKARKVRRARVARQRAEAGVGGKGGVGGEGDAAALSDETYFKQIDVEVAALEKMKADRERKELEEEQARQAADKAADSEAVQ